MGFPAEPDPSFLRRGGRQEGPFYKRACGRGRLSAGPTVPGEAFAKFLATGKPVFLDPQAFRVPWIGRGVVCLIQLPFPRVGVRIGEMLARGLLVGETCPGERCFPWKSPFWCGIFSCQEWCLPWDQEGPLTESLGCRGCWAAIEALLWSRACPGVAGRDGKIGRSGPWSPNPLERAWLFCSRRVEFPLPQSQGDRGAGQGPLPREKVGLAWAGKALPLKERSKSFFAR